MLCSFLYHRGKKAEAMKVLVIGANGQIGKQVVKMLQEDGKHSVRAMVRKEEQVASFEKQGVEACW